MVEASNLQSPSYLASPSPDPENDRIFNVPRSLNKIFARAENQNNTSQHQLNDNSFQGDSPAMPQTSTSAIHMTSTPAKVSVPAPSYHESPHRPRANLPHGHNAHAITPVDYSAPASASINNPAPASANLNNLAPVKTKIGYVIPAKVYEGYVAPASAPTGYGPLTNAPAWYLDPTHASAAYFDPLSASEAEEADTFPGDNQNISNGNNRLLSATNNGTSPQLQHAPFPNGTSVMPIQNGYDLNKRRLTRTISHSKLVKYNAQTKRNQRPPDPKASKPGYERHLTQTISQPANSRNKRKPSRLRMDEGRSHAVQPRPRSSSLPD